LEDCLFAEGIKSARALRKQKQVFQTGVDYSYIYFFPFKKLRKEKKREEEALVIISKCYAKNIKRGSA
jgi:hypothetical protein